MLQTKKDVDRHVRSSLARLREDEQRNKGYSIARLYYRIGEYTTAVQYLSSYTTVNDKNPVAHKFLGECYDKLKKPDKALAAYQRSLELDKKQSDVLVEVCKLLQMDELSNVAASRARYYYELAESRNIQDEAVLNLKLKHLQTEQNGNGNAQNVQEILLKEVKMRPFDIGLRICLLRHYLAHDKVDDAFKTAYEIEMKQYGQYRNSTDWYMTVKEVLDKYKAAVASEAKIKQDWSFWLLSLMTVERQVYMKMGESSTDANAISLNLSETASYLNDFDQLLQLVSTNNPCPSNEKELNSQFFSHFRGQLCMHAAALLFKREIAAAPRDQWQETTRKAMPLLMLAYNCGVVDNAHPSLRNSTENTKVLVNLWRTQSAFRCSQAGRTLISCVDGPNGENNAALANLRKICNEKYTSWSSSDDVLTEIRRVTTDSDWRKRIQRQLFTQIAPEANANSSYLVNCGVLQTPNCDWPQLSDLETYEEIAQNLEPSSLSHLVYLALGSESNAKDTAISPDVKCMLFSELNFTVPNLQNCAAETLNKLDADTFLYAATIQAKRTLEVEKSYASSGNTAGRLSRPKILLYANMANRLCTEEQASWWTAAYKVYNSLSGDELPDLRATLQNGIEAIRGVASPKIDVSILLKLGQLLVKRSQDTGKLNEKMAIEARAESLYKYSLYMIRMQSSGRSTTDSFRRLFKYPMGNQSIEKEVNELTEEAITFLAERYFRNHDFEECIDDLAGIRLPFATYFQAEACRKITELANTSKKDKRAYIDKAKDYLTQTLDLLDGTNVDKGHPLKSIVHADFKRLQQESRRVDTNQSFNDSFVSASNNSRNGTFVDMDESISQHRQRRDVVVAPAPPPVIINNNENIEKLIREMMSSLTLLKDDVADVRERMQSIEEQLQKKSADLGSVGALDEYLTDEDFQQVAGQLPNNWNNTSMFTNTSRLFTPNQSQLNSFQHQQSFGPQDVSVLAAAAAMNNPINQYLARELNPAFSAYMGYPAPNAANAQIRNQPPPPPLQMRGNFPSQQFGAYGNDPAGSFNQQSAYTNMMTQQGAVTGMPGIVHTQGAASLAAQQPLLQQMPQAHQMPPLFPNPIEVSSAQPLALTTVPSNTQPQQKSWNLSFNNAPVEKAPPVNVVITSSDPLPSTMSAPTVSQASMSVIIPPQHIKNGNMAVVTPPSRANPTIMAALQGAENKTPNTMATSTPAATPSLAQQKAIFGSASTSTPKSTTDKPTVDASKPSPFASFSFGGAAAAAAAAAAATAKQDETKTQATANFASIFSGIGKPTPAAVQPAPAVTSAAPKPDESGANTSKGEDADDYVPTAHFEPVIALPDLVEVKTGEENETILFEHRAKLLRFVREGKEWKERGVGNMKVLVNKNDVNKVRLLMRRDQIFKLCCNQMLAKDTQFKKMPNSQVALTWYGQDYSENELQTELLAIRFKTADLCQQFYDVIVNAQAAMTGEQSAAKPVEPTKGDKADGKGFGDQFKPKAGSWTCEGCYLTNDGSRAICQACNAPKDKNAVVENATAAAAPVASKFTFGIQPGAAGGFSFGAAKTVTPVDKAPAATVTTSSAPISGGFSFGGSSKPATSAPAKPATSTPAKPSTTAATPSGFGDQFKPKPGAWSCKACYTSNTADSQYCLACEGPKDDTVPPKPASNAFGTSASTSKFSFGSQPEPAKNDAASSFSFGTSKTGGFSFGNVAPAAPASTAPIDVPKIGSTEFGFVFKPKSPGKAKSPLKAAAEGYEDVTDDENVEEEENNTYFAPVIPLPDKIDVKTGEEEEQVLYSHRAKLFRFNDSQWKERGLGDVKILQHKASGRMRVVMRREQVLKICLNHALDHDIDYIRKDDKSWHFVANDYSEGELSLEQLCLRFKTAEIAAEFKQAVDDALGGVTSKQNGGDHQEPAPAKASLQSKLSAEENKKIADLKLPANFFDYKNAESCPGCRGCNPDEFVFPAVQAINVNVQDDNPLPLVFRPIKVNVAKTASPGNLFSNMNKSITASGSSLFGGNTNKSTGVLFGASSGTETTAVAPAASQSFFFGTAPGPKLPITNIFGGGAQSAEPKTETTKSASFSFGNTSVFGNSANTTPTTVTSIFGGGITPAPAVTNEAPKSLFGGSLFGAKPAEATIFGNSSTISAASPAPTLPASNLSFSGLGVTTANSTPTESNMFKLDSSLSFNALASAAAPVANSSSSFSNSVNTSGGFFGLSTKDDFSNLMTKPAANGAGGGDNETAEDPNYDPHYDPIIALPDEITVTTGEEDERKLFGERAKLFRFDATNREWKERGVGEFKILHHPKNNTYRLLLRREQVYKCVLNQAMSADLQITPMKQSDKAFCWVGTNFAEDTTNGVVESLSVRFKNAQIAQSFDVAVKGAIEQLNARGELEPEED